ncbi:MAG: CHAT domain-containing protein [Sphaerospermopsis sp. SIO1G1]|nr:CHAT domain-containing protein [Sphaerospermopsis sp. SIO1G1]
MWDFSVARAAQDQTLREKAFKNKAQLLELAEDKKVKKAEFSPDGRQILTTGWDGTARLWDAQGNILTEFQIPQDNSRRPSVKKLKLSPDGRYILGISRKTAYLWDNTGNLLTKFEGHKRDVKSAEFSPDSSRILTVNSDKSARLWDIKGNLLTVFQGHDITVRSAVFSPDGRQVLTNSSGSDKTARLWDTKGNLLAVYKANNKVGFDDAKFSPNGRHILTSNSRYYGNTRLWDKKGNLLQQFTGMKDGETRSIREYIVEFSPNGNQIIIAIGFGRVRLWDIKGNLLAELLGHDSSVNTVVFSPDGRQILTSSSDKTVRLWDTKGNLLGIFRGHEERVSSAVFSPDGKKILSSSWDRTARVWDIETGIKTSAAEVAFIKGNQLATQDTIESKKQALQSFEQALKLYRTNKNNTQAALTLLSIGKIHASLGQFQSALDSYNLALPLSKQVGAEAEQADILKSLGQLYRDLADMETAVAVYNQALSLLYQLNDQEAVTAILNNIGDIHAATEKRENALKSYNQALLISRSTSNLAAEANALTGIGNIYIASQEWQSALNAYKQAFFISKYLKDKIKQTTILNQLGRIYAALGQNSIAIENYNQALSLSQQLGFQTEEANIVYNQAIFNYQQNNFKVAQTKIKTAINIIESLRTQITNQKLRLSYFASTQDYYQFYIDLLMEMHQLYPNQGYDAEALHISERARARNLLELITESHANIRTGVDTELLQAEQDIKQQLDNNEKRRVKLFSGEYTAAQKEALDTETSKLLTQYRDIQTKIRNNSPRYAAITEPQPLTLAHIQEQVLDENSIILEYYLGKDKSYLWAISKTEMTSYELPKNAEIETLVKKFRGEILKPYSTKKRVYQVAAPLTKILIEPVADKLSNKRLVIIGDGALQYLPFAALPIPESEEYQPLIINHEIISLPSASTIPLIRTEKKGRKPATKSIAILADPVFTQQDERLNNNLNNQNKLTKTNPDNLANRALQRSAFNTGIEFERLPFTRKEAETILKLIPKNQSLQALDFAANINFFTNPQLSQYQIVHLATHGILDSKQPELSGLVLSLFNAKGEPENGFLRLHDIFNLNLSADLVVLSACQTGLGQQIKGEGVVGLTTGFIYAGSPRVVMSLWNVDDQGTFVLMEKFYQKMFQEGLKPSTALRQAQIEMFNDPNFSKPDYWAAFTVLGDWR